VRHKPCKSNRYRLHCEWIVTQGIRWRQIGLIVLGKIHLIGVSCCERRPGFYHGFRARGGSDDDSYSFQFIWVERAADCFDSVLTASTYWTNVYDHHLVVAIVDDFAQ
jgi:hypothetical protein